MKKFILLSLIFLFNYTCFAQLPDLVGKKSSIKQLKSSFGSYIVERGQLLDVGSSSKDDNIYTNASISGSYLDCEFVLLSNNNGIVTEIKYLYDNLEEIYFNTLKNTIIKVHNAQYQSNSNGISTYTSTISGIKRYILFVRRDSYSIITFKL